MRAAVFVFPMVLLYAGCGQTQPKDRSRSAAHAPPALSPIEHVCEAPPLQTLMQDGLSSRVPMLSAPLAPEALAPLAKHVIIVSEDGMRPDLLTAAEAPLHHRLMAEGAYSLRAMTIRRASTLPSHAAMLSGFDVEAHGLYWNSWRPERGFIKVPTVFSAAADTGKGVAAFVGKQKLAHIIRPEQINVFATPSYLCRKVAEEAIEYFLEHKPQVEFVHFSDPDSFGHKDGWMSESQRKAVRSSDRCLRTLIDGIAASELARDTLVIVSADHGGHGHNHSGSCLEDRLIPWFAWGVGVKAGHKIGEAISTVDTAATTLWALGLSAPAGQQGRPVKDAFR
ncbi:MAG: alkaline phosphatase [Deltaproteobacteria bacterium]|nr:alkaline phosphatase [Deltaproteobacteria bacterium]